MTSINIKLFVCILTILKYLGEFLMQLNLYPVSILPYTNKYNYLCITISGKNNIKATSCWCEYMQRSSINIQRLETKSQKVKKNLNNKCSEWPTFANGRNRKYSNMEWSIVAYSSTCKCVAQTLSIPFLLSMQSSTLWSQCQTAYIIFLLTIRVTCSRIDVTVDFRIDVKLCFYYMYTKTT